MPRRGALTRLARPLSPRVVGQVAAVQAGGRSGSAQSHATDTTTDGERSGPRPALRVGRGEAPVGAAAATATAAAAEPFPRLARHPPSTGRQPATAAARDDKRGRRHLVEARRPGRWPRRRVAAQPRATRRRSSRRQRFGSPPSSKPQRAEHARWGGAGDPPAGAADGLLKPRRAMGERGPVAGASPNACGMRLAGSPTAASCTTSGRRKKPRTAAGRHQCHHCQRRHCRRHRRWRVHRGRGELLLSAPSEQVPQMDDTNGSSAGRSGSSIGPRPTIGWSQRVTRPPARPPAAAPATATPLPWGAGASGKRPQRRGMRGGEGGGWRRRGAAPPAPPQAPPPPPPAPPAPTPRRAKTARGGRRAGGAPCLRVPTAPPPRARARGVEAPTATAGTPFGRHGHHE